MVIPDYSGSRPDLQPQTVEGFIIWECILLNGMPVPTVTVCFINPGYRKVVQDADLVLSVGGHHFTTLLSRDLVSSINYDAMAVLSLDPIIC